MARSAARFQRSTRCLDFENRPTQVTFPPPCTLSVGSDAGHARQDKRGDADGYDPSFHLFLDNGGVDAEHDFACGSPNEN
jgi:hypothetical protein